MILETHAHADHITAASYFQRRIGHEQRHGPTISIGCRIKQVQDTFRSRYGLPAEEFDKVFDKLFDDEKTFQLGSLDAMAIHLPGYTPDHLGYKIGGRSITSPLTPWEIQLTRSLQIMSLSGIQPFIPT